jgi:hypothetical protein
MIIVIQLKQGKKFIDLSNIYLFIFLSDKDDDSTADEEDLLHTRIKRRSGRSPNSSQIGLNSDV